jgi:hypothetical protein
MANRTTLGTGGAAALVLIGLGLTAVLLGSSSTTVGTSGEGPIEPPDDGSAVVVSTRSSGGFSLLGIDVAAPDHSVTVRFLSAPECAPLLNIGSPWPLRTPDCPGPSGVIGEVTGFGLTSGGDAVVDVEIDVSTACHEATEPGSVWPGDAACGA